MGARLRLSPPRLRPRQVLSIALNNVACIACNACTALAVLQAVYLAVYKNFMESIDAIDNGGFWLVNCFAVCVVVSSRGCMAGRAVLSCPWCRCWRR